MPTTKRERERERESELMKPFGYKSALTGNCFTSAQNTPTDMLKQRWAPGAIPASLKKNPLPLFPLWSDEQTSLCPFNGDVKSARMRPTV